VEALEVGRSRAGSRPRRGSRSPLDQGADASAEDDLFAEEVGLGLLGECRLEDAASGPADPLGIGEGEGLALAGVQLSPVAIRQGRPPPLTYSDRTRWPGPLGATSALSTPGGRDDLAEVDVEPVRAEEEVARSEVGLDVPCVDLALDLVGQEDVDQVARLGASAAGTRLEAVLVARS